MNAASLPGLPILILAAGFSTRLGQPKALARVHGVSLLRRTLALAKRFGPAEIIVVVPRKSSRCRIEARGLEVVFAANSQRAEGMASSVRRGLRRARYSRALLLLPVDLVDLQHRDVARLISRWRASPRRAIARRIGFKAATPLILPRWLYAQAGQIAGDVGLRELVNRLQTAQRVLVRLPSAAADVDTPQDLREARRRFRLARFKP